MYILASIFIISVAEIIGMFSFRFWQLRSGKVICEIDNTSRSVNIRDRIAKYAAIVALYAEQLHHIHIAPRMRMAVQTIVHHLAEQIGAIHKKLVRVRRSLEGRNEVVAQGEASPFFKTIAEYKLNGSVKKENPRMENER